MSRINNPSVIQSLEASQPLFAAVGQQLGVVPNLMRLVGHSPTALEVKVATDKKMAMVIGK